jgi:HD superfamily phosphodiesterase
MSSLFALRGKDREELARMIVPFVTDERFVRLRKHRQHVFFNRYEHLIHTASLCFRIAKLTGADVEVCVLSGLLHDFHETRHKNHRHALAAAENATSAGMRDERVLSNIRAHMFPFGFGEIAVPKTREFAVLKVADFIAATVELCYGFLQNAVRLSFRKPHPDFRFRSTERILERIALWIEA